MSIRPIRILLTALSATVLYGCGLFPQRVAPPNSLVTTSLADDANSGNAGPKTSLQLLAQSEGDFVRTWKLCVPNESNVVAANCDEQKLLKQGMAVIDDRCGVYFAGLGRAAQDNGFGTKAWNLIGGTAGAIEGLTGVSAKAIALTSSGFGLGSSSSAAFADAYIFSADVSSVQALVTTAQQSARESIAATIKEIPNPSQTMTRDDVAKILKQYEKTCEVHTIRGLINQSLQKAQIEANTPPSFTSDETVKFTVGKDGSFTVSARGYPAPTFDKGQCPAFLQLDKSKGILSGTPKDSDAGSQTCVIIAHNGNAPDVTQTLHLDVLNADGSSGPGGITSASSTEAAVDEPFTFRITTSFTETTTITAVACPAWVTFDGKDTLIGKPTASNLGKGTCLIKATPASGQSVTQQLTIDVRPAPSPEFKLNLSVK